MRLLLLTMVIAFSSAPFTNADLVTITGDVAAGGASLAFDNDIRFEVTPVALSLMIGQPLTRM